jgi:tetratricopeptide (TPR) repeat protein
VDRLKPTPKSQADVLAESFLAGYALARTGRTTESENAVRQALELSRALALANPSYRRDQAALSGLLGFVLWRAGRNEESIVEYQRSIATFEDLAAKDPRDQRARIDLGQMLGEVSRPLGSAKRIGEAREATARALATLRPVVDSKSAAPFVLVSYAGFLLSAYNDHPEHAAALACVQRANRAEKPASPDTQEVLAHAYAASGDLVQARETAKKALDSLPSGADPDLRKALTEWASVSAGPAARSVR